jgi:hypothetical protein
MALCYARLAQHVSDTMKKRKLHLDAALAYIRAADSLPEDDLDHVCTYYNAVDFFIYFSVDHDSRQGFTPMRSTI